MRQFNPELHCGARKTRTPGLCTHKKGLRTSHPGIGRCWLHGGKTPIKSGKYSKVVKQVLRDEIEKAKRSPELLSLDDQIALLRVLLDQQLTRMEQLQVIEAAGENDQEETRQQSDTLAILLDLIKSLNNVVSTAFNMRFSKRFSIPLTELQVILQQIAVAFDEMATRYGISDTARSDFVQRLRNVRTSHHFDLQLDVAGRDRQPERLEIGGPGE